MKSPAKLVHKLRRQWEHASHREERLLGGKAWPLVLSIGRPPPGQVASNLDAVRKHVEEWRAVRSGTVVWESIAYRAVAEPVSMPLRWQLDGPADWIEICADRSMRDEFEALARYIEETDPVFHSLLVRRRSLWRGKPVDEVLQAARLAMTLAPGCAEGLPLRALSLAGIDTKFFERNARLVTALLDARYDGEAGRIGLHPFLGALAEGDHWLLVVDLDGGLLPFAKQRVRSAELRTAGIPAERILIIENESCQHLLPPAPGTVAILGAGFDLSWTDGEWLASKKVAYWGDLDTWGLRFLAMARSSMPHLTPLLMTSEVFARYGHAAVPEAVTAGSECPAGLIEAEAVLHSRLLQAPRGRLEQEFLPAELVQNAIMDWLQCY